MGKRSQLTDSDLGSTKQDILRSLATHVEYSLARDEYSVTDRDLFVALALSVRDRLCDRWTATQHSQFRGAQRRVYYLSLEFLIGRLLGNAMLNLGIEGETHAALDELEIDYHATAAMEEEPGLGNGGLGRLAACFLDSMATLGIPAIGYGIRYEYGIFRQEFIDGQQMERPDSWLRFPNPWEIARPERLYPVRFGGHVELRHDDAREVFDWLAEETVMAMAYDTPVPGYRNDVVNTLRLWSAKATREFDVQRFSAGDYFEAVRGKNASENLTRVLYPSDQTAAGRELRLKQEYFFVSATLQDALRRHLGERASLDDFADHAVLQLNDTHPAVAVAELMRLLIDEHGRGWDAAWAITTRSFAYTNHTILSEALEQWPVDLFGRLLPRHLQIVFEINRRFLDEVRARFPGEDDRVRRMSIIAEGGGGGDRRVRMAHLAVVGSYYVNGVSGLHGQILRDRVLRDFAELWPERFGAVTNGVTPRRWIRHANAPLAELLSARIGDGWVRDLRQLARLEEFADDPELQARFRQVKRQAKLRLAATVTNAGDRGLGDAAESGALFDVQVKRIHEYKRQLLCLLHAVHLHRSLHAGFEHVPRVVLFAGKAAPSYAAAKDIIRLIHDVGATVNGDPETQSRLRVVMLPNYSVSLAERIIPAADLSEQISTAGTEASGTGNMKLTLNGALTIGTLDGANIEIRDAVGEDNFFLFGMVDAEVEERRRAGYDPGAILAADGELAAMLDAIASGAYTRGDPERARAVIDRLRHVDPFMVLADFAAYVACQRRVETTFRDSEQWTRMAILNIARGGGFSSDVTIARYASDIWHIPLAGNEAR